MRGAPIQRSYHRRALLGFILLVIAGLSPLVIPSPARAMPVPGSSVTIVGNPPSIVTGTSEVTFAFVGVNHHPTAPGYWCSLSPSLAPTGPWTFCSSPWTITVPSDGEWRFTVAMPAPDADGPGVVDYVYAWHDFVVANDPPVVTFTDVPGAVSSLRAPTLRFTVAGAAASATCRLDNQDPVTCWSSFTPTNLAAGDHTVTVTATNPAGQGSASYTWRVQPTSTPPAITSFAVPNRVSGPNVTVSWSTSGVIDRTECMRDENGAWFLCSSPYQLTGLAAGEHMFSVRVINGAGTDQADASWSVDPTFTTPPPTVTVTSKPAARTTATAATFLYTLSNATSASCLLDGVTVGCSMTRLRATGLAVGPHQISIVPIGSIAGTAWTYSWVVTPVLAITGRPANGNTGDAMVTFRSSPGATVTCSLDGSAPTPCASPWVGPGAGLTPGTHRLVLSAALNGEVVTKTVRWNQA
jgi:hypothetical protein